MTSSREQQQDVDEPTFLLLRSDLEHAALQEQEQRNTAQLALDQIGALLEQADGALTNLEDDDVLGSAIVRGCSDLANAIGELANRIDSQSDEDRRALAQACIQDAQTHHHQAATVASFGQLALEEEDTRNGNTSSATATNNNDDLVRQLSAMSQDDVMSAISAAASLLRDVEATLRAISDEEAEEIADVALTVAHLFVASLQSVHASLTPEHLQEMVVAAEQQQGGGGGRRSTTLQPSSRIELLEGEDEDDNDKKAHGKDGTSCNIDPSASCSSLPQQHANKKKKSMSKSSRNKNQIRALWPPLGPAVGAACHWGKDAAAQQPILAVALGLTLWPAAVLTTVIALPIVAVDGILQDFYDKRRQDDCTVIQCLEQGAAQVYHTGRLSLLCGKLVTKQTLRVANRQVQRHGGVGQLAQDVAGFCVDRAVHPIETVVMAWNGLGWGLGMARDAYNNTFGGSSSSGGGGGGTDGESDAAALDLQQ